MIMADNNENKVLNVPPLRFPEFTGEWQCKAIEKVAPLQRGFDLPTQNLVEGIYPVIYSNGILQHHDKYKCEAPGLITGRSGTIGKFTYIDSGFYWPHNTSLWVTDFCGNCPKFIYYLYQTVHIEQFSTGSGVPTLNRNDVHRYKTSVPTAIVEQEKIAKFLSILDERIVTQNKIIEKLQSLIKGLVDELMTVLLKGKLYPFSSFYIKAGEGGTPTTSVVEYYTEGTIPFIKIEDLSCKYLTNNKDFITELGMQKSSAWLIPSKSVIYSNGATIGAISINEYPVCTKQGILGIVPNTNINVEYLYLLMSSSYFSKEISRIITEGTMKTAYLKDINHIKCPLPSMAQQKNITNLTSSIEEKLSIEQELLRFLNLQKQYLLHMIFI